MANQEAIQRLIANNQLNLARTKVINNDISRMEVGRLEQANKLMQLGVKSATKLIGDFHTMRMENLQSEAYNDFYENQYKDYLNSDELKEAETILGASHESGTILHSGLGEARQQGVPGDIITKAASKHPMYGATYSKLQLGLEAGKFEGYMRSAMAKDTTLLTLPDVIDPRTGSPKTFRVNEANTLKEKHAAHRYLRGKFFTTRQPPIGNYGKAFLSLPTERGGSGFLQTISNAEHGKDGMFARYAIQSDIFESNERIDLAIQAFDQNKSPENFQNILNAYLISVDDNGQVISPEKAWKKIDTFIEDGVKGGQVEYKHLAGFAAAIVPGSKSKKYPNGMTYAQKWPNRFGYKDGKFGKYFTTWQKEFNAKHDRDEKTNKITFKTDVKNAIKTIEGMEDKGKAREIVGEIYARYGANDEFNSGYAAMEISINKIGRDMPTLNDRIDTLIAHSDAGFMVTDELSEQEEIDFEKHPILGPIIQAEKARQESGTGLYSYEEQLSSVLAGTTKATFKSMGGINTAGLSEANQIISRDLHEHFDSLVKGGMSPVDAATETRTHFIENGGDQQSLTKELAAANGLKSNKYSLDGQGKLVSPEIIGGYQPKTLKPSEKAQKLSDLITEKVNTTGNLSNQGFTLERNSRLDILSGTNSDGVPVIIFPWEADGQGGVDANKVDYNKNLFETREVNTEIIAFCKNEGISLSDFFQARLTATGQGELDERIQGWLGTKLIKYLPKGMKAAAFGTDLGLYNTYEPANNVSQKSPAPIINNIPALEQFNYQDIDSSSAAFFLSQFAKDGLYDLTPDGALVFSEAFNTQLNVSEEFSSALMQDVNYQWYKYAFGEGPAPTLEGIKTKTTE